MCNIFGGTTGVGNFLAPQKGPIAKVDDKPTLTRRNAAENHDPVDKPTAQLWITERSKHIVVHGHSAGHDGESTAMKFAMT